MSYRDVTYVSILDAPDDKPLYIIRRDMSGGQNTRQHQSQIGENQATKLYNIDLIVPGKRTKRRGSILIGNDVGDADVSYLFNFIIQGETDQLLMLENTTLWKWIGYGNWSSIKADFTADDDVGMVQGKESGLSPDDVVFVNVGGTNWFRIDSDGNAQDLGNTSGTGSDSPPQSTVGAWYQNRFWVLKNDLLSYSDAYSADYSSAFDTVSNSFRIPVGEEMGIVPTRDTGMVIFGREQIWGLAPSATPAATDKPEPLITSQGCIAKKSIVSVGDDIYWFAQDGVRSLKRTIQDKLQLGVSYPISFPLQDEFDDIDWTKSGEISAVYFNNRVIFAVPVTGGWHMWVYYPATQGWAVWTGLSPKCFAKYKINGEERLYYGKENDGTVYQLLGDNYTDEGTTSTNGTAINYQEEGRLEDVGQPHLYKKGGEIEVRALAAGDYNLAVSMEFDDNGFNTLGIVNLAGNLVTFPTTFPVNFGENIVSEKFHLDQYGRWRGCKVKIQHSDTNGNDDITVLEHNILTYPEEYQSE